MTALRIAGRRLARAPRRVLLTVALGAGGLAAAMVIANLARGIYDRAVDDAARSGPGHLTVLPDGDAGAWEGFEDDGLLQRLRALPGVEDALPRLFASGLASGEAATRAALLAGIDLARERDSNPALRLGTGAALHGKGGGAGALVASALAEQLGVSPGDPLLLAVPLPGGGAARGRFVVAGVLHPALDALEDAAIYLDYRALQDLAGAGDRLAAAAVLLRADLPRAARNEARAAVRSTVAARRGLRVATWEEALPMLRDAIALDRFGHRLLLAAIVLVVGLGAAVAVATSILERSREQGLLAAIGAGRATIAGIVLAEGLLLGAAALCAGLALGTLATAALARWGLDLRPLLGEEIAYGGVLVPLRAHAGWDWAETFGAAAAIFAAHAAAALAAAVPALRRTPAGALRFR